VCFSAAAIKASNIGDQGIQFLKRKPKFGCVIALKDPVRMEDGFHQ
jgi:hypothetical protein